MGTAVVVGAGIGGLAAAVAMRGAGWDVRVVERAASPRELGFALLLAPNAVASLRALGVADRVIEGGVVAGVGEMRRPDGTVLRRLDTTEVQRHLGAPAVMALRPVLHGALLDALGEQALVLGSEVVGYSIGGEGVHVRLASGQSVSGHVLIGADGVRSIVRRQLHPEEGPPRASGLLALRGVSRGVVHHLGGITGAQYFGRGIEAGLAQATDHEVYWFLSIPAAEVEPGTPPRDVLHRFAAGFHEPFREIVLATRDGNMRLDELFDREPLERWAHGPVTLLGDAAHPMLPHAGQGAAQALEVAVALGRAFARGTVPEPALREYERVRAPRAAAIVRLARRNARLGSVRGALAVRARDLLLQLIPDRMILRSLVAIGRTPDEA